MLLITTVLSVVIATVVFFGVFMSLILKCAGISRPDSIQYIPLRVSINQLLYLHNFPLISLFCLF